MKKGSFLNVSSPDTLIDIASTMKVMLAFFAVATVASSILGNAVTAPADDPQGFEITEPRSGFTVTTTNGEGSFALEATDYMDFGQSYVEVSLVSDAPTSNGRAYEIANVSFEGKVAAQDITLTISEFPAGTYSGGVGKSALTCQYVYRVFVESYDPSQSQDLLRSVTIEDQYQKIVEVDGIKIQVEMLDTAGTEQFMALHSIYMKSGDGFVLVFSLTTMESLSELSSLREQILRLKEVDGYNARNVPLVLVGNKIDLVAERQVPREIPVALTTQTWGGVPYYETSARNNINVSAVFEDVLRQIVRQKTARDEVIRRQREEKKKKSKCIIL
ncbi:MAG: Ras- protein rsr1 [Cyphobasidiales sp. Tagirdzhanova-0007]|nr:MAG: Ras- protein rsr1 [Cyphobasidiales sp. Tagirdzhanova-0007]